MVLDCLFVSANPNICVNHFCGEGSLIQQPNQKGYSNDPQKYKGMIEKVNISQVLNSLSVKANADFFYGEESNGIPLKIKKNDFFNLLPFKNYGILEGSLDDIGSGFGYNSTGDGSGISGMFFCVNYSQCRFQLKSDLLGNTLKARSSNFNGEWTNWKSISFT